MASPVIKIKRSAVSGNAPTTSQLELGELALNTYDGKLFTEINTGSASIVEIGSNLNTLKVNSVISDVTFTQNFYKNAGITTFNGNAIHANVYSTGISTISGFRFPTSDGSEDQAIVTDGNGALSFKTLSGSGGATGTATTISAGVTTATQGQTAFTTVHPHNDGTTARSVQVFHNGIKLRPSGAGNATKDFTASSNSTITLHSAATLGDEVRTIVYYNHTLDEEYFTASEGQTLFTLTGSSAAQKYFRVYINGVKLRNGTDYGVAAPVTLASPCAVGDNVEIVCDDAEDAFTATDQQVSFTPTATSITEDNMQVFINGVQQTPTVDYSIGDPAVTLTDASGLGVGDEVDVCIRRS